MATLLALLLTLDPAPQRTQWMNLQAFHLAIGMSRTEAMDAIRAWQPKTGKNRDEILVDYADDKSLTLEFRKDRLRSVRFEMFVYLPEVRRVFDEQRASLRTAIGQPRKATKSILIYDNALPNVIVVANDDPKTAQGKRGLGVLAVRYFDPR